MGGASSVNALATLAPAAGPHAASRDTVSFSGGRERPSLRLRHKHGGKHDLHDSPGTAGFARAELVRCRLAVRVRAVNAEMRCPTNEIAESGV